MSLLGDFLESFYGSGHQFQSVHARVRHERHSPAGPSSRRQVIGKPKLLAGREETIAEEQVFWAVLPTNARVETMRTKDGQIETTVEITRGTDQL